MIDREKVLKGLERCKLYNKLNCDKCPYDYNGRGNGKSECTAELATDALELLKEQGSIIKSLESDLHETLEVVSGQLNVVRCKDCKHGEPCNEGDVYCTKDIGTFESSVHKPEWFCAYGERTAES